MLGTHRPAGSSPHIGPGTVSGLLPPGCQTEFTGLPVTPVLPAQHYDGTDSGSLHAF